MDESLARSIDHILYATPHLDATLDDLEQLLGVRARIGGQHLGRGTRNALVALGGDRYLEIVGPDPAQPAPASPRWFEIDRMTAPRVVAWVAKSAALEATWKDADSRGVRLGAIAEGSRLRSDGLPLTWRFTDPTTVIADGIVPFYIDWGASPHPSRDAASGCTLIDFRAEHPTPDRVSRLLSALHIVLDIRTGPRPALIATIDGPQGRVELR